MNIPALTAVLNSDPGAKPVQQSVSFQGLGLAFLAFVAPQIAQALGVDPAWFAHGLDLLVQGAGFLVALYGILRRSDIRLPWSK